MNGLKRRGGQAISKLSASMAQSAFLSGMIRVVEPTFTRPCEGVLLRQCIVQDSHLFLVPALRLLADRTTGRRERSGSSQSRLLAMTGKPCH